MIFGPNSTRSLNEHRVGRELDGGKTAGGLVPAVRTISVLLIVETRLLVGAVRTDKFLGLPIVLWHYAE